MNPTGESPSHSPRANATELVAFITQKHEQGEYDQQLVILGNTLASRLARMQSFDVFAFALEVELTIFDCRRGYDSSTEQPMPFELQGQMRKQYTIWKEALHRWAQEAFNPDFNRYATEVYQQLNPTTESSPEE